MRRIEPVSADQMVLSFLRAEIDSPTWGPAYANVIKLLGLDRTYLIDNATYGDKCANDRALVLGVVRGYGRNEKLFAGFPAAMTWRRVLLDPPEFGALRYMNSGNWRRLTRGTLSVIDGAQNVASEPGLAKRVDDVREKISRGTTIQDLILVDDLDGKWIILEGNTRATAFMVAKEVSISALLGNSPRISEWVSREWN